MEWVGTGPCWSVPAAKQAAAFHGALASWGVPIAYIETKPSGFVLMRGRLNLAVQWKRFKIGSFILPEKGGASALPTKARPNARLQQIPHLKTGSQPRKCSLKDGQLGDGNRAHGLCVPRKACQKIFRVLLFCSKFPVFFLQHEESACLFLLPAYPLATCTVRPAPPGSST